MKYRETADLQEIAKTLFNRQRTQEHGVNKNNVLKHLILAQLNDELPALDPQLLTYINDKRIPGADLFLRMIGCPNVLALRELAVQHRYLLTNGSPMQKKKKLPIDLGLKVFCMYAPGGHGSVHGRRMELRDVRHLHARPLRRSSPRLLPSPLGPYAAVGVHLALVAHGPGRRARSRRLGRERGLTVVGIIFALMAILILAIVTPAPPYWGGEFRAPPFSLMN